MTVERSGKRGSRQSSVVSRQLNATPSLPYCKMLEIEKCFSLPRIMEPGQRLEMAQWWPIVCVQQADD
jgi:hypothetical protein